MKKLFIITFAAMVAMNVSAQMNVWENGGLAAQYAVENVDSITFGITSATPESGTGKDGITPLLKIENDYWFISYDEGVTWQQEGKAKGEKGDKGDQGIQGVQGETGPRGEKGDKGDSMFQAVTQDSNFVYLTLLDSTIVKLVKAREISNNDQPNSEFIFTITYDPNGGEGVMQKDTFYYGLSASVKLCTFTKEGHYSINWNTNPTGTGASYKAGDQLTIDRNITLYAQWIEPIDLGLSVKWANANIGANAPESYGYYYAWGEVEPKNTYVEYNYKWCNGDISNTTKYSIGLDDKTTLEPEDDAATVNWGISWRIPTKSEITELYNNCTFTVTTQNGKTGYKVTSNINGNSIFLPAAGYRNEKLNLTDRYCWYMSSSLDTSASPYKAWGIRSDLSSSGSVSIWIDGFYRDLGLSIRPVCP